MKDVEWGEFRLKELFDIVGTKSLDSNAIDFIENGINFVGRTFNNNGIQGKIARQYFEPNKPFTITATVIGNYKYVKYQKEYYYCSQNINKFTPKPIIRIWNEKIAYFFITSIQNFVSLYDKQQGGYKLEDIKNHSVFIPTKNGEIDFDFMETFIANLEAQKIAKLEAYLKDNGLDNYELTEEELRVLEEFESGRFEWGKFNLEKLFGKSSRGKRLKSSDRVAGELPFVTAGEAEEGVSAHIGNNVTVFPKNTTTIDMFGSAKYRNYDYGGDDHIAVVYTQGLPKFASIFTTTAIHKTSYTGEFHYGRNFYAKDADALNITLPTKNNQPNYDLMQTLIGAVHKLVVKDLVLYVEDKR